METQFRRVNGHRVLAYKTADARHLGYPMRTAQLVTQVPVLHRTQLIQRALLTLERVLINPAHAGGIGSQSGRHPHRNSTRRKIQVFQYP